MSIRRAAFLVIGALAAIGGWAALVRVEDSRTGRMTDVTPLAREPAVSEGRSPEIAVPEPVRAASDDRGPPRDWLRSYHESTDDFLLATELVPAAMAGDGAAQHQLGRLLLHCEEYKRILAPYTAGSIAERVEFHLASGKFTEQGRSEFRRSALRCARLFTEDPFAGYDVPDDAKDFRYWAERAVVSGDPVAVMNSTFNAAVDRKRTDETAERAFRESLPNDLRRVVFSGNGAALYTLGGMLAHPSITADADNGYAWSVVACESGYDCSNSNPDIGFGCVERGTCEPGSTFLDVLQRDLGSGHYAELYAKAQDIQYKIKANDWDGLQQYLEVK